MTAVNGFYKLSSLLLWHDAHIVDYYRKRGAFSAWNPIHYFTNLNTEMHLIFAGYFRNYFGYSSFKVFNADIFKNNSSLWQQSYICCNFFTLKVQSQLNIHIEVVRQQIIFLWTSSPPPSFYKRIWKNREMSSCTLGSHLQFLLDFVLHFCLWL